MSIWVTVPAPWEDYEVSEEGHCRNIGHTRLKKITYDTKDRPRVSLRNSETGEHRSQRYHHILYRAFWGEILPNHVIIPINGDWHDMRPDNLEQVSMKEFRMRHWAAYNEEQDRIFNETRSELDDWIFGSCTESEEERRARLI